MSDSARQNAELAVYALASGSSGNAFLVRHGSTSLLIDAGIGIRLLASHLNRLGVSAGSLNAILVTHEHTDHSASVAGAARKYGAPVFANARTLSEIATRAESEFPACVLETGDETRIGSIGVRSFPISHDAVDPVGFVIGASVSRICYATDLGCASGPLRDAMRCADLVILESNHDEEWLRRGPYTPEMKARVASDSGHLSNRACAGLLAERAENGGSFTAWLAHLSRVNNSPALARKTVVSKLEAHTRTPVSVEIALRDHPSVSWRAGRMAVQLSLF